MIEAALPVVAHERTAGDEFELVVLAPEISRAARPGQFVEIVTGPGYTRASRRPFSIYRADPASGTVSILYLARGSFTTCLSRTQVGDTVTIIGPLGRPFTWPREPATRHILVAGGIGAPPIYFLAREICRERAAGPGGEGATDAGAPQPAGACEGTAAGCGVTVINAARSSDLLVGMAEFGALDITLRTVTDDGSWGAQGIATDLLLRLLDDERSESPAPICLYACGPHAMLRAVAGIAIERGLPCQVSVETAMPCGVGLCGECRVAVLDPRAPGGRASAIACVDGPVFDAHVVDWGTD